MNKIFIIKALNFNNSIQYNTLLFLKIAILWGNLKTIYLFISFTARFTSMFRAYRKAFRKRHHNFDRLKAFTPISHTNDILSQPRTFGLAYLMWLYSELTKLCSDSHSRHRNRHTRLRAPSFISRSPPALANDLKFIGNTKQCRICKKIRITKQSRMRRPNIAFKDSAWYIYKKGCTQALKSVYRCLFSINFQPMVNIPRTKRRLL